MLQVNDIGPQITAFQNTYNFCIGQEFFGRIRKDQSHNHVGSMLENSTFSVIRRKKKKQWVLCIYVLEMKKVGLHHYCLYQMSIVTFLIHTVETHMACL